MEMNGEPKELEMQQTDARIVNKECASRWGKRKV